MRIGLFILGIVCFIGCSPSPTYNQSLNGAWEVAEYDPTSETAGNWMPAKVPGTIQTDLLALEEILDPFLLNNEDSIQWVSDRYWMYKKQFSISKTQKKHSKHLLFFDGLDTYATVFLNDSLILKADNAFRKWEVDVSGLVQEENELKVLLAPVGPTEIQKAEELDYELPEAPRVFTRKPQFQYGWDWGPTIKTMGIWRGVTLQSYTDVNLQDVYIQTEEIGEDRALLKAKIKIVADQEGPINIVIKNTTTGVSIEGTLTVKEGTQEIEIPLTIEQPKLWWTHNLGEPFLYSYEIELKKGSTTLASKKRRVGLRTIELITDTDEKGESFYFELNGVPVYMKGANYIPQNIFLPEVTLADREQLLDDAIAAHMNMLRVWGGGVYEDDTFYDLCDEKGILLWQDFMFACAMYPGDEAFLNNVKQEAIDNVTRLRHHPSIALWCGNNENSEGWHRWGWQAGKTEEQKAEIWGNYQKVFNELLPQVVDSLNPSISYWESSPKYGRGDKRYQFEGDAHDWWVWHDGYPFEHFEEEVPRFMSEFGFQSFPSYEAIQEFTQQDSIDIAHPSFATHQKHSRGFQLIREYMERDFPVPEKGEDYVYMSQLVQAHGMTKGIEAHRRARPYNMGTLYWQLNDCWPVVSWSSIDGLGNWKALHFKAAKVFEEVLISVAKKEDSLNVYVVNDTFDALEETLTIETMDFEGNAINTFSKIIQANPQTSTVVYSSPIPADGVDTKKTYLRIQLGDKQKLFYLAKPKELQLPEQVIEYSISETEYGFELILSSPTLQKEVFIIPSVPGKLSDNFFDLLPREEKTIQFTTDANKMEVEFKTLNAFVGKSPIK